MAEKVALIKRYRLLSLERPKRRALAAFIRNGVQVLPVSMSSGAVFRRRRQPRLNEERPRTPNLDESDDEDVTKGGLQQVRSDVIVTLACNEWMSNAVP